MGGFATLAAFVFMSLLLTNVINYTFSLFAPLIEVSNNPKELSKEEFNILNSEIELLDFSIVSLPDHTVSEIYVQLKKVKGDYTLYDKFPKTDIIISYLSRGAQGLSPSKTITRWVPFKFAQQSSSDPVIWKLISTENDILNPISLSKNSGSWDEGETITLKILFNDGNIKPYYRANSNAFFSFVFSLPNGVLFTHNSLKPRVI
ncbi:MAG: hypothetical protein QXX95_03675 [Nitrososphaerales archaeon]